VYHYDKLAVHPSPPVRRCLRDSGAYRQKVNEKKAQFGKYAKLAPKQGSLGRKVRLRSLATGTEKNKPIKQSFPNFSALSFWLRKITMNPDILPHVNIQRPDESYPKLKFISQKLCLITTNTYRQHTVQCTA
jgi:hypothetical protein